MNGSFIATPLAGQAIADAIIEALAAPAAILDDEFRVISANSGFLQILSTDFAHVIGRELALPGGSGDRDGLRVALSQVGIASARWEMVSDLPSGGRRVLTLHAARLAGPASGLAGISLGALGATGIAATGLGQAEISQAGISQAGISLGGMGPGRILLTIEDVTERGAALSSSVSLNARVLAAATHDLRQPLQAMTLLGSLLARQVSDARSLALIRRLEDTVATMSGMLNTLLDINRWETEAARAEPGNFALADLFVRLECEFADRMQRQGMRWRVVPCRQTVHSDQRLIGQILRNMIRYALEHAHDGRMLLGARRHGQRLRIELWQSESRMADADVQGVYDALRPSGGRVIALNPTLAPGIAMVRRLADLLGHRVDVGFRPGRGSVFSVEVPLAVLRPAAAGAPALRSPLDSNSDPGLDPGRTVRGTVFVIDDNAAVRETMRDLLEATGWATEVFSSAEEFLMTDRLDRTGCILVDALLPGMPGVELLRRLKERRHRLPTIMLTGAGDVPKAVEAMAAGALNFVEKPVRFEELLPSIERAFDLLADSSKVSTWREQALQRAASLTARQRQILDMVLAGEPSRNIAADLGVSRRTVENHRAVIMKKLGAASIPQLIRVGIAAS